MGSLEGSELDSLLRILDIIIFIGRHLVAIVGAIVLLSIGAAIYSLHFSSFVGIVFSTLLSLTGTVFLMQVLENKRTHRRAGQGRRPVSNYAGVAEA